MVNKTLLKKIGQVHNTAIANHTDVIQRTLKTLKEMLHDRGYQEVTLACKTFEDIEEAMNSAERVIHAVRLPDNTATHVYFCSDEKVGVKHLRTWCEQNDASTVILIVSLDGPTTFTKKEAESCAHTVHFFSYTDLSVNVTRHVLVPPHRKIDHMPVMNGIALHKDDLPRLSVNDKISLYYAYQPGDIIEITRVCGAQQPQKYWRIVSDNIQ